MVPAVFLSYISREVWSNVSLIMVTNINVTQLSSCSEFYEERDKTYGHRSWESRKFYEDNNFVPIPVAEMSKSWFCGRSIAGILGSSPSEVMNFSFL
jgi:hypothetical protein